MHNGAIVVRYCCPWQGSRDSWIHLFEVVLFARKDVVQVDLNEVVPVNSALLVPATQSVENLVYDNALVFATCANGDLLLAANSSDVGIASLRNRSE